MTIINSFSMTCWFFLALLEKLEGIKGRIRPKLVQFCVNFGALHVRLKGFERFFICHKDACRFLCVISELRLLYAFAW